MSRHCRFLIHIMAGLATCGSLLAQQAHQPPRSHSWIYVDSAVCEKVHIEGDELLIPVEYYLDPAEARGETTLNVDGHGVWIDRPDGKYTTRRHHVRLDPPIACRLKVKPGRGRHVFRKTVPNAQRRNRLLFVAYFTDADGRQNWNWDVRRTGTWYRRRSGFFEIETDRPGNLFTYDEHLRLDVVLRNVGRTGAQKTAAYTVYDTTGAVVSRGGVPFSVLRNGQRVPIHLKFERRGVFLVEVSVEGWEKRETTFARIPDLTAITEGAKTKFGATRFVAPGPPEKIEQRCRIARMLGLTACRGWLQWNSVQPGRDTWKLEQWDRPLQIARRHGIDTWLLIDNPPRWVLTGGMPYQHYSPFDADWQAWQEFVRVIAERWHESIYGFEWLNEILARGTAGDPVTTYLKLCRIGTETARSVDPDLKILLAGGLWPRDFRLRMLKAGVGRYIDVLPVHYSNGGGVAEARDDLDAAGLERVAVWDDETAWGISTWGVPPIEDLTHTGQCRYVLERWPDELAAGVERIIYFGGEGAAAGNWDFMMDDLTPRPVAATLAVLTSKLHGAEPVGVFTLGRRGMFHLFERDGQAVLVASSYEADGETIPLHVGSGEVTLTDYQGNESVVKAQDGVAQLALGPLRHFVEGADLGVLKAHLVASVEAPGNVGFRGRVVTQMVDTPRLSVLKGKTGAFHVRLRNLYDRELSVTLEVGVSEGWPGARPSEHVLGKGEDKPVTLALEIPEAAAPGDYEMSLSVSYDWGNLPRVSRPFVLTLVSPDMVGNMLRNGDFEQPAPDPRNPPHWRGEGNGHVVQREDLGLGSGRQAYRFEDTAGRWNHLRQALELPGGQTYLYTAWISTGDMSAGSNINMTMKDGTTRVLHDVRVFTARANTPHREVYTARFKSPPGMKTALFTPVVNGEGWAMFDNLRVTLFEGTDFAAECHRVQAPPRIDGSLDEWTGACPIPLIGPNQLTRSDERYEWTPRNLSAAAWLRWDVKNLYVAFKARDNVHHSKTTGPQALEGDSLVLAIHPANRLKGRDDRAFAYYICSAAPGGGSGRHTLLRPARHCAGLSSGQLARDSSVYELAIRREGDVTTYEVRLPWTELGGLRPVFGGKFGLSLQLNDNDGHGRAAHMNWGRGLSPAWRPTDFGVVTFDD